VLLLEYFLLNIYSVLFYISLADDNIKFYKKKEKVEQKKKISFRGDWDVKKKIINCRSRQKTN